MYNMRSKMGDICLALQLNVRLRNDIHRKRFLLLVFVALLTEHDTKYIVSISLHLFLQFPWH